MNASGTRADDRPRGGLTALCLAVTINWGILFYALPTAVTPIAADTGWSPTLITGIYSCGLVLSAVLGVPVGRLLDRTGPRALMTGGALVGTAALLLAAWSPHVLVFTLAWLLAGAAQTATLYPPAIAVITRWYGAERVRPLTALTLFGAFASTVFSPITAFLVEHLGWHGAFAALAGILLVTSVPLHWFFLNAHWTDAQATTHRQTPADARAHVRAIARRPRFVMLQAVMLLAGFTMTAVTINIIPLLLSRGMEYGLAAVVLGLVGAGQVIGRLLYPLLSFRGRPAARTILVYGSGAACLWGLALTPGPLWLLIVLAIAAGAARGCDTLLRATAVSDRWGTRNFGALNGRFSMPLTIGAALAPVAGPAIAGWVGGYALMAVVMAGGLTVAAVLAART
ncbi:MFS transporter [Brevibacterium samyangense]|uniref:MFS transporter n=1 Tax=Brevibacterium samyangense TaxID=366888 RepID=A0ABN2T890_9MICO